jgi:hypothetical protein
MFGCELRRPSSLDEEEIAAGAQPPCRAAKLVIVIRRLRLAVQPDDGVGRVQRRVAIELEQRVAQLIAARPGHHVDHAGAGSAPVMLAGATRADLCALIAPGAFRCLDPNASVAPRGSREPREPLGERCPAGAFRAPPRRGRRIQRDRLGHPHVAAARVRPGRRWPSTCTGATSTPEVTSPASPPRRSATGRASSTRQRATGPRTTTACTRNLEARRATRPTGPPSTGTSLRVDSAGGRLHGALSRHDDLVIIVSGPSGVGLRWSRHRDLRHPREKYAKRPRWGVISLPDSLWSGNHG